MEVTLIDSPFANVASIRAALSAVGAEVSVSADTPRIASSKKVILPGVGSFAAAMSWLDASGVAAALRSTVSQGSLLLGICVGHQLLFEDSNEETLTPGLAFLNGKTRRFSGVLPVPQIGWNRVQLDRSGGPLFNGISSGTPFYFVNSYRVAGAPAQTASSDYGGTFTAAAQRDNIFGVQFHPERSSTAGLRLLRNFLELS